MRVLACLFCLLLLFPFSLAQAEDTVYALQDASGTHLTSVCYAVEPGDEYIAADNTHYRVTQTDDASRTATMERLGQVTLPDVGYLRAQGVMAVFSDRSRLIAIYCTHSDESYVPTDGTSSTEGHGGIYDVAYALSEALEAEGIATVVSDNTHLPHDNSAYRRSRQTAAELVKQTPDVLLDIHRDGIPDPDEYETRVEGQNASMVRLLVGRSNPNVSANKDFALQVKATADELYPGLIKDIFIGKGTYNQDLMPHALLLEFGTHTISKELVLESTQMMASVLDSAVYGDVSGGMNGGAKQEGAEKSSAGAGTGILIAVVVAVILAVVYAVLTARSGKGVLKKLGGNLREMGGGLFGKRKE